LLAASSFSEMLTGESVIRGRDLIIFGLFVFTLYHCWNQQTHYEYEFEPIWFVQNQISAVNRGGVQTLDLVYPEILDLNGDGKKEMVTIVKTPYDADDLIDQELYRLQVRMVF
jgi:hypothetical protein